MPRKRASRGRTRTGSEFARKLTLEVLEERRLLAVDFNLLKDINTIGVSSNPKNFAEVGSVLYFTATDGKSGEELWKSDGSDAGTVRVKDIRPGTDFLGSPFSSSASELTNVGGTLYFRANDGTSGYELWKSDGTDSSTVRVKDIYAGSATSFPRKLTNVNGTLYFTASDATSGYELWKSDGTEAGTVLVRDIRVGIAGSVPCYLANIGGTLYFTTYAYDGELWKSDGTEAGTVLVKDFTGDSTSSGPSQITEANGRLFVAAGAYPYGIEIWVADLTADPLAGEYNSNGKVDAADYVLWRHTLGSTVDLRANGSTVGVSAGVIDQSDYSVWRSTFGNPVPVSDPGAGSGLAQQAVAGSSLEEASRGSGELGVASGEGSVQNVELGVGNWEFGVQVGEGAGRGSVVSGDSPSPRPSPRGRGRIETADFAAESNLLLLLDTGIQKDSVMVADEVELATSLEAAGSADVAPLAALDAAFADVHKSIQPRTIAAIPSR